MATVAYRRHLTQACAALQKAVVEIAGRVPGDLSHAHTRDPALRSARSDAADALGRYTNAWVNGFEESLAKLVEDALTAQRPRNLDLDSLGIMDDERVQEEVEVVQAGRTLGDDAGGPLHRLQRLEAELRGPHEASHASPVNPAAIGRALWRATERLPLSLAARSEAVRSAVRLLGPRLGPLYLGLIDAAEHGEGIAGAAVAAEASVDPWGPEEHGANFDVTRPGALVDLMDRQAAEPTRTADFLLTQPLALEGDGSKVPRLVHHHRDRLATLGTPESSVAVMSLIGRIFDEILADPALDAEAATWIGRLQPAVQRLAAEDAELLQNHRHPAWTLVNQLATLFTDDAGQRPPNLAAWLSRVVATLQASPRHERFEAINRKLSNWRAAQTRSRLTEMAPTVELLRRHAQLEAGVEAVRKRLERRLDASRADEAVRRFVAAVWALVCAQQDADGAAHDAGQPDAWDTATDLMWSTSPARSRVDAPTLVQMIPELVDRLRQGMERLGLDAPVRDAWLERLSALHLRALRRPAEDAQTDMPLTIDLALEDELPPADQPATPPVAPRLDTGPAVDPIASLEIGDRLAMRVQGVWADAALVWRSDNGHFLLFAGGDGGTLSITRRSLERLLGEGLARMPDTASALARATRRIAAG